MSSNQDNEPPVQKEFSMELIAASAEWSYYQRRLEAAVERVSREHNLHASHYRILLQLRGMPGHESPTVKVLAERVQLMHHSTLGLLKTLEKRGYIKREKVRAVVHVRLLPAGEMLLNDMAHRYLEDSTREMGAILSLLHRVYDLLQKEDGALSQQQR